MNTKTKQEIEEEILKEKLKGTPDIEIGRKFGVSFKFLEKLITKTHGVSISSVKTFKKKIKTLHPKNFQEEQTTVWSFKQRGNWATHSGEYRGNWSPYIPRNIILKYSFPGELVLDYFCGAGTTAVECKLLGRRCIALDINDKAIQLAKKNLDFEIQLEQIGLLDKKENFKIYEPELIVGDARDLSQLPDSSVDLICSHPPYANAIHYTSGKPGDLSFYDVDEFLKEMEKVAKESFRVLKPGRKCAILIGDIRRKKHVVPLGFKLIDVYLNAGFKLKELVIKRQHNCKTTGFWYEKSIKYNFLLLAHEYLPIFEKPEFSGTLRENALEYQFIFPQLKKLKYEKKLERLETTTVWVFSEKDFEQLINRNVVERYSDNKNYFLVTFDFSSEKKDFKINKNNATLIFIKSPSLEYFDSYANIEFYMKKLKEMIEKMSQYLDKSGFIVIQTRDVRINGYIEPLAKKIVDMIIDKNLWLKEIIVVTHDRKNFENSKDCLEIVHQYLLVYEVTK